MRTVETAGLAAGTVFMEALYHQSGLLLIPSGDVIDAKRIDALRSLGVLTLHMPEMGERIAPFLFQCRFERVDVDNLRQMRVVPFDLYDGSEALIVNGGQTMSGQTVRTLEASVAGGLFRLRNRDELRLGEAEAFLAEFPVPVAKPSSDTAVMRKDHSRLEQETTRVRRAAGADVLRALVAEDNENIRKILVRFLADAGFLVREAADGKEALHAAGEQPPDVAVLDIMMPRMDGYTVCRRLKADSQKPPVIIMCTAKNTRADVLTALQSGADDYIVKPFTRKVVIEKIVNALERRRKGSSAQVMVGSERRRSARSSTRVTLTWTPLDDRPARVESRARVRNLSLTGLAFERPRDADTPESCYESGAVHPLHPLFTCATRNPDRKALRLFLELGPNQYTELTAYVVHVDLEQGRETVGVAFDALTEDARAALQRHLSAGE